MSARSKYFKRKYKSRSGGLKLPRLRPPEIRFRTRSRRLSPPLYEWLLNAAAAAVMAGIILMGWRFLHSSIKIKASAETVAALRVPSKAVLQLKTLSAMHGVSFSQLFTIYCVENNFFPDKPASTDAEAIELQYVQPYDKLKSKYDPKSIQPYFDLFRNLFDEVRCFPIPAGYEDDEDETYMFGDSWGSERNFEGDKMHSGTDILDRENIRGRIPVVSMTDGSIEAAGWHEQRGYQVVVLTENGTFYLYAHLDNLEEQIVTGQKVRAGQLLGTMGDTGFGKEGARGKFQVHLHIGISPKAGFSKNFRINPYPILRYIEDTKIELY